MDEGRNKISNYGCTSKNWLTSSIYICFQKALYCGMQKSLVGQMCDVFLKIDLNAIL